VYGHKLELDSLESQLSSGRKRTQNTSRRLSVCIAFASGSGGGQGRHYDDSEEGHHLDVRYRAPVE